MCCRASIPLLQQLNPLSETRMTRATFFSAVFCCALPLVAQNPAPTPPPAPPTKTVKPAPRAKTPRPPLPGEWPSVDFGDLEGRLDALKDLPMILDVPDWTDMPDVPDLPDLEFELAPLAALGNMDFDLIGPAIAPFGPGPEFSPDFDFHLDRKSVV